MKDRIRKLLLDEGLTSGAFADEIGVQRSSLSHILNGRNNPSLDFVIKTKNRFSKLNLSWLLLGEGDMYHTDIQVNDTHKKSIPGTLNIFDSLPEKTKSSIDSELTEPFDIPVVDKELALPQVDQIVIFYSDQSFRTYRPKKSE
ncbi:MAG: helix-turn-helix transcriptional regulator [Bacteroidales bacterium]|nr:helix-turn-helix transcriptional regulator [Bacteroidales bacterium]